MILPIAVKLLEEWVPHRPPMVWVDEVSEVTSVEGACRVRLRQNALYQGLAGVRPSALIEWVAQSFGYIRAAQHILGVAPIESKPTEVFLVGVSQAQFFGLPDPGSEVIIRIKNVRALGPLVLFEGQVFVGEKCLFQTKIKVYSA